MSTSTWVPKIYRPKPEKEWLKSQIGLTNNLPCDATMTVVAMVKQWKQESNLSPYWGALPILADAMEDAGCTDEGLLLQMRKCFLTETYKLENFIVDPCLRRINLATVWASGKYRFTRSDCTVLYNCGEQFLIWIERNRSCLFAIHHWPIFRIYKICSNLRQLLNIHIFDDLDHGAIGPLTWNMERAIQIIHSVALDEINDGSN